MTAQIGIIYQVRRGTSTQVAAFTPAQGEMVGDMTLLREVVGDGSKTGGFGVGKAGLTTLINSSAYTVTSNDVLVVYTVLSTAVTHTITLPLAANYPSGQELRIQDGSTTGGSTIPITLQGATVANATGGFDTINGSTVAASFNSGVLNNPGRSLISNGSTGWYAFST